MAKKYFSSATRSRHTYTFFKERQNEPKWRNDFLEIRRLRRRALAKKFFFLVLFILLLFALGWGYKLISSTSTSQHADPVKSITNSSFSKETSTSNAHNSISSTTDNQESGSSTIDNEQSESSNSEQSQNTSSNKESSYSALSQNKQVTLAKIWAVNSLASQNLITSSSTKNPENAFVNISVNKYGTPLQDGSYGYILVNDNDHWTLTNSDSNVDSRNKINISASNNHIYQEYIEELDSLSSIKN